MDQMPVCKENKYSKTVYSYQTAIELRSQQVGLYYRITYNDVEAFIAG